MSSTIEGEINAALETAPDAVAAKTGVGSTPPEAPQPAGTAALSSEGVDELVDIVVDEDVGVVAESGIRPPPPDTGTTGIHRRVSTPPPLPKEALRPRAPSVPPPFPSAKLPPGGSLAAGAARGRVSAPPPPPPPPMPADFAALRSQLQRVNGRYNELLCERARLQKQLEARDRALDTLRLQNADLQRVRSERTEVEDAKRALAHVNGSGDNGVSAKGGAAGTQDAALSEELKSLRADRAAYRKLVAETADHAAMKIELQRLRETHVDAKRLREAREELEALQARVTEGDAAKARLTQLEARLARDDSALRIAQLEAELVELRGQRTHQADIAAEALEELESTRLTVAALSGQVRGMAFAHAEVRHELRVDREQFEADLAELSRDHGKPRTGLSRITGIGPTFAKRLSELGIDVATIAGWDDDDVELVAAEIRTQPARIVRQRWIEQAKAIVDSDA